MNGYIYTKPIANGTDNCLILNQGVAYQVPFTFGSDWTSIKIGMFLSFTYSDATASSVSGEPGTVSNSSNIILYSDGGAGQFDDTLAANAFVGATATSIYNGTETVLGTVVSHSAGGVSQSAFAYEIQVSLDSAVSLEEGLGITVRLDLAATDNNASFPVGYTESSGSTSPDTYGYFGIIKDQDPKFIPPSESGAGFIGLRFENFEVETNSTWSNALKMGNSSSQNERAQIYVTRASSDYYPTTSRNLNAIWYNNEYLGFPKIPFHKSADTTEYMAYIGMQFDAPTPVSETSNNMSTRVFVHQNFQSDPSLQNLNSIMAGNGEIASSIIGPATGNTSVNPVINGALPDSLFFYNPFFNAKPRIHAWAVKKLS